MARLTNALLLAVVACGGAAAGTKTSAPTSPSPSGIVSSNVRFEDYAGTRACASCHASYVASWLASPMHNMTRDVANAQVRGPFDGSTLHFHGDTARLETVAGERRISVTSSRFGSAVYRVTRVVGGHHREDYVGVRVDAPGDEVVLPVSFVYATRSLRYKGYSVMLKERAGLRAGPVWAETCIFCHNTPPYLSTVLGALAEKASPYQGVVVDGLLPIEKRAHYTITNPAELGNELEHETTRLGGPRGRTPNDAIAVTRARFRSEHLVEVGIGCEACHLGSAEHVKNPRVLPSFAPKSAFLSVDLPHGESKPERINRACARCHQVLFSGYEPTWEGGARHGKAGGSNINSGEARDMLLGACGTKLSCADCHEPHAADATASLRALDAAGKDALCTRCHEGKATKAHTHHDPAGPGARCVSCHMPRKNLDLDGGLGPYHRIGSPTSPVKVLLDRPLECALCHAEKSVGAIVGTMETWYRASYDRSALVKLYGSLDANVLLATAERGKPHEQAVAFHALGEAKVRSALPLLARQLTHPLPIVRGYAKRAIDAIEGRVIAVDIDDEDAAIDAKARSLYP